MTKVFAIFQNGDVINMLIIKHGSKSKELTNNVKKLIVEMKLEGKKMSEIENLLDISESNIRSIRKQCLNTGR